jgi:hypothetical protein
MNLEHRIFTEDEDDRGRSYWECSCGTSGSAPAYSVDVASDKHIKYDQGEGRTDISRREWQ